jgi:4-hydroxy-4-methyl-2-oxoglutarate aldolase
MVVSESAAAEGLAARLSRAYTGAVYDVLRGRGIRDTILAKDIVPLDRSLTLAGPVFTMRGRPFPGTDAHQTLLAWTDFLGRAPPGHVVVCEGNDPDRALMGELSAETLQKRGVAGYVTDGGCRDCGFIQGIRFPVFSRYRTPRDVVGEWMPESFDVAVKVGGVAVNPRDYLIGDIDGVVIIPSRIVAEVVEEVEKVMSTENLVRKAILSGVPPKEAYLKYGKF